jgi:transcriptional regulator with XRE-family HTH domain
MHHSTMTEAQRAAALHEAEADEARAKRLLRSWIQESRKSDREVEADANLSQGHLGKILDGTNPLRIRYIAQICSALGRPLASFYRELAGLPAETVIAGTLTEADILRAVREMVERANGPSNESKS